MRKYIWMAFGIAIISIAVWLAATRRSVVYEVKYTCDVQCEAHNVASNSIDGNFCSQSHIENAALMRANHAAYESVRRIIDSLPQNPVAVSNIENAIACHIPDINKHGKIVSMFSSMDVSSGMLSNRYELTFCVRDYDAEVARLFMEAYFSCLDGLVKKHNTQLAESSLLQTRTGVAKIRRKIDSMRSMENGSVNYDVLHEAEGELARLVSEESRIKEELKKHIINIRLLKGETIATE